MAVAFIGLSALVYLTQGENVVSSEPFDLPLQDEPTIKLVRDHRSLQKALGNDHFLVRAIVTELRRRQREGCMDDSRSVASSQVSETVC